MTRTEKILGGIDLSSAVGLEVGALDNPIVPPTTPGIFYIDHVDTPTLREKYKDHPNVNLDKLVEVNGVWGEKTLAEAAAAVAPVDFFVASHVIEHVPNLIGWLQEISSVLKPGGHVRLVIPDRRFTFDLLRRETGLAEVLTAHLVKARTPQIPQIIDHFENVTRVDAGLAWAGTLDRQALDKHHGAAEMFRVIDDALKNGTYHDVHCWVFTPHSFARLMERLADLEYHSFACHRFHDTELNTYEFFVSMERVSDAAVAASSWRVLAGQIEQTQAERAAKAAELAAARA
jgi:2-polyprenyl-3-methyl-5-hydroxy-6-metoxy-1,4-benzoquinol methylase